jgi:(E)-4-hydroxy-3-methylbut-2-enyl-diphosphate synthase
MSTVVRRDTVAVKIGNVQIGAGAPVAVQSMTNTETADIDATSAQIIQLADAGSEMIRISVNTEQAAAAVEHIVRRVRAAGHMAPIIGDFHYNGHRLLAKYPQCASLLDKYRINPGNVGAGTSRDKNFAQICQIAADNDKPIRIGVNIGSLNKELVMLKMIENTQKGLGKSSEDVMNECMILSALESTQAAIENGVSKDRIVISCKSSTPRHLIDLYRELSRQTDQPLHLGLTEAGIGIKGLVWSAVSIGVLLDEGIGDTIRVSLTPRVGGDRRDEVYAACEILQSLGLRSFAPSVTACPGCGRTTSQFFQALAEETEAYVRGKMPEWKRKYIGVETLTLAVMGCIVNGPGESRSANIGISLPGTGEEPKCPVYVDGNHTMTLAGTPGQIGAAFREVIDTYVQNRFPPKTLETTV